MTDGDDRDKGQFKQFRLEAKDMIKFETDLPIVIVNRSSGPRDIDIVRIPAMDGQDARLVIQLMPTRRKPAARADLRYTRSDDSDAG